MTRAEVLAELREVLNDKVQPYGWSDRRLLYFLSLGQDQFCKDTGFFRDHTTYTISAEAGTASYAINSRIIEVREVWLNGAPIQKFAGVAPSISAAQPFAWQTDLEPGKLSLYPTPDTACTLELRVWRKSITPFSTSGNLELPDDLHLAPVEWAAHLAFMDHDRELQDPVKSADHKTRYDKIYVPQGKQAFRRLCAGSATFVPNSRYLV